jgi:ABC-type sugar transport system ATPase subunit
MVSLLIARDVGKRFGATVALDSAQFELLPGEVHALLGENGAGKSTLARIFAGSMRPDHGQIWLNGRPVSINHPLEAQRLGIGIIHQELDLFPHLTIGENLVIGNLRFVERGYSDRKRIQAFCQPFLRQVGLTLDPRSLLAELSIAQQQLVAIARAISMDCGVVIMDEPSSALTQDAADRLFEVIVSLRAQGTSIIYVSHKMDEIFRLCDRATVLRDGKTIGTREIAATNPAELIQMMVGRTIDVAQRPPRNSSSQIALSAANLTTRKLKNVSFELRRGEVLGVAGLLGAGRSELGATLIGLSPILGGSLQLMGTAFKPRNPSHARHQGLGLVPEDRNAQGLMMHMSVQENSTLAVLPRLSHWGFLRASREADLFAATAARLRLRPASSAVPMATLSGGNQQKTLLARWLIVDPQVLFLDDPARGIDVAAKEDIYQLIDELAAAGKSILLASSELTELLRCSDRILVLNAGRVAGLFAGGEATQGAIMAAAARAPVSGAA